MSVNQRSLDEVVLAYIEAWSTPDAALRRELLDMSVANDGSYTDPVYEVWGKEELADLIDRALSGEAYDGAGAGARIPISSGVDQHHGMFRFSWVMVDPQQRPILEGNGLRGGGSRRSPAAHHWLLRSVSAHNRKLARTPGVARRVILLSNS